MKSFEDIFAWQKARVLCRDIHAVSSAGHFAREFGLRDQIRRAAISVMSNIAEGFGRYSRRDFHRFLAIARGSTLEMRSQLYVAVDLNLIDEAKHRTLQRQCVELERMIAALRSSLRAQDDSIP
jgi:four helix bundle protein